MCYLLARLYCMSVGYDMGQGQVIAHGDGDSPHCHCPLALVHVWKRRAPCPRGSFALRNKQCIVEPLLGARMVAQALVGRGGNCAAAATTATSTCGHPTNTPRAHLPCRIGMCIHAFTPSLTHSRTRFLPLPAIAYTFHPPHAPLSPIAAAPAASARTAATSAWRM